MLTGLFDCTYWYQKMEESDIQGDSPTAGANGGMVSKKRNGFFEGKLRVIRCNWVTTFKICFCIGVNIFGAAVSLMFKRQTCGDRTVSWASPKHADYSGRQNLKMNTHFLRLQTGFNYFPSRTFYPHFVESVLVQKTLCSRPEAHSNAILLP